jgi:hypothetical protein
VPPILVQLTATIYLPSVKMSGASHNLRT